MIVPYIIAPNNDNRFWLLAAKRFSQDATPEEGLELEELLNVHPEYRQWLEDAMRAWAETGRLSDNNLPLVPIRQFREQLTALDQEFHPPLPEKNLLSRYKPVLIITLIILLAVPAYLFFRPSSNSTNFSKHGSLVNEQTVIAQKGLRSRLTLPDGSTVMLNSDSRISYNRDFSTKRELFLSGEAYFDVVKDADHPFIIHTEGMKVKVIGTAFNIRAYPGESSAEASLIRGSIEVILPRKNGSSYFLKPHEKLVISHQKTVKDAGIPVTQDNMAGAIAINTIKPIFEEALIPEIAWTENRLVFQGMELAKLADELERWFGKPVRIESPGLGDLRFTGNFRDESLETILQALQLSKPFRYRVENQEFVIYE